MNTPDRPEEAQLRAAADELLAAHRDGGPYPSVSALAQRVGINRTTFYRRYPDIARYLLDTAAIQHQHTDGLRRRRPPQVDDRDAVIRRLRTENTDLRRHVEIYEEHIRMLTTENLRQREQLERAAQVASINDRCFTD